MILIGAKRAIDEPVVPISPAIQTLRAPAEQHLHAVPGAVGYTLDIVSRLDVSDVNEATLDAIRITVDKLCSEYARRKPAELIFEGANGCDGWSNFKRVG